MTKNNQLKLAFSCEMKSNELFLQRKCCPTCAFHTMGNNNTVWPAMLIGISILILCYRSNWEKCVDAFFYFFFTAALWHYTSLYFFLLVCFGAEQHLNIADPPSPRQDLVTMWKFVSAFHSSPTETRCSMSKDQKSDLQPYCFWRQWEYKQDECDAVDRRNLETAGLHLWKYVVLLDYLSEFNRKCLKLIHGCNIHSFLSFFCPVLFLI